MGYKEAVEDHVRILNRGQQNFYFPLCQHCGKEVKTPFYDNKRKYTCTLCKLISDKKKLTKDVRIRVKKDKL